jgi:general secretion pathway protein D
VPVQTAQAYPFGIQTGQPNPGTNFPSGGFPVINYEPTGLTLKFTPQVFTNLDVQVKMSIESKDVLGASTLTPTFTERTITGTARVQNNRTMMLASIRSQSETNGRRGLPLIGLIPVLGRLFTAPTRDVRDIDVVIAVTPRVLRAPAVTPRDEEMRPSGTLQSPTTGSLEAMIIESDREDQLAAGRRIPRNAEVRLPDVEPVPFAPPARTTEVARSQQSPGVGSGTTAQAVAPKTQVQNTQNTAVATAVAKTFKAKTNVEELPAYVPAPKSLVNSRSATELAAVNPGAAGTQNAVLTSLPKPIDASANVSRNGSRVAQLGLTPSAPLKVGEKRRFAINLTSDLQYNLAVIGFSFNPKVVNVLGVSAGSLFLGRRTPLVTDSTDPSGSSLISISAPGGAPIAGSGILIFIEVEAIAAGDAGFTLNKEAMHLVATDSREVVLDVSQVRTIVK